MRKIWIVLGAVTLLSMPAQLTWANCTPLINEGRQLLSKANLPADESAKIKGLLDEAQKYRDSGDHTNGAIKANEALNLLKKN